MEHLGHQISRIFYILRIVTTFTYFYADRLPITIAMAVSCVPADSSMAIWYDAVLLFVGLVSQALSFRAVDLGLPVLWMVIVVGIMFIPGRRLFCVFLGIWSTM